MGEGVRSIERAQQMLDLGVQWVIMGTTALDGEKAIRRYAIELGEHLLVSVDSSWQASGEAGHKR